MFVGQVTGWCDKSHKVYDMTQGMCVCVTVRHDTAYVCVTVRHDTGGVCLTVKHDTGGGGDCDCET